MSCLSFSGWTARKQTVTANREQYSKIREEFFSR